MINLPHDLKEWPHWLIANEQGAPCHYIDEILIPVDPREKGAYTFEEALIIAEKCKKRIGFYLTDEDPFCCIDLDVKDQETSPDKPELWTTKEQLDRYGKLINQFDSYTELSRGGKGVHIWLKGAIGAGARREGVEVYSQERFIICTGNVIRNRPILDRQELLEVLISEMRLKDESLTIKLDDLPDTMSDDDLLMKALKAENSHKFNQLFYEGNWVGMYPSQSEADLALMSMIAFYTQSNRQCRRLFRSSALGQREKATKNNYHLDRQLQIIRHRQRIERIEMEAIAKSAEALANSVKTKNVDNILEKSETKWELDWPPGMTGELAKYIYHSSTRPVKEYSIATTLGILAGLCGKAFNIPKSGLNLYVVIVGRSGTGKEVLHDGPSLISKFLSENVPGAEKFFDFTAFVSGQALMKAVVVNNCFVNINGEFGRQLKRLAVDNAIGSGQAYRTALTHLYQKSGAHATVGGLSYSKKEESVGSAKGVAYSMMGESTPDTFYESLTPDMMEDGFMSRFIIIEYKGLRAKLNENSLIDMSPKLKENLCGLAQQVIQYQSRLAVEMVEFSAEAQYILKNFDKECDEEINKNLNESVRQVWNRAHLKALKLSALLSVFDNFHQPVVNKDHANWALNLIRIEMETFFNKLRSGGIGISDDARIKKIISILREYIMEPEKSKFRKLGIIKYEDIRRKSMNVSSFRNHKNGAKRAIEETLAMLRDMGAIAEVDHKKSVDLGIKGRSYYILDGINDLYFNME